jgi:hypothetical protein
LWVYALLVKRLNSGRFPPTDTIDRSRRSDGDFVGKMLSNPTGINILTASPFLIIYGKPNLTAL